MAFVKPFPLSRLRIWAAIAACAFAFNPDRASSQTPLAPAVPMKRVAAPARTSNGALENDLDELRGELRATRQQVEHLEAELGRLGAQSAIRPRGATPAAAHVQHASDGFFRPPIAEPVTGDSCEPAATSPEGSARLPFFASYRYDGGGGFTQFADADEEFSLKVQNQLTLDGTFFDHRNMPTAEKGFNIPFYRTYLFGNFTRDWDYQVSVQGFLGEFNVLDAWINYTVSDELHVRAGRMLSPFLYEYWAFSPAWEPVITNSLLFQVGGKRQMGVMAWGRLFENRAQYQAGIFNGIEGGFFDLDRSVDFLGSFTATPWKGDDDRLENLGLGASVQTGMQNYALNAGNTEAFINGAGEPTLNFNYIGSSGIPFFQYNDDVAADGYRTKFAPHVFWYGRFSVHAEYVWQRRRLADKVTTGSTIMQGYQATAAYLLTGESHSGDGLAGWATVIPRSPFIPSKGECGPGAWEVAFQYSEIDVGTDNFDLGFADLATSTNRLWQTMLGLNWWPNKYTRMSFDWVHAKLNRPVPTGGRPLDAYNTFWTRAAMFF